MRQALDGCFNSAFGQHGKVAGEHDGVAMGGLVDDEQLLSGNVFPVPDRQAPRQLRLAIVGREQAILIALKALLELTEKQLQSAECGVSVRQVRLQGERVFEISPGLFDAAQALERQTAPAEGGR